MTIITIERKYGTLIVHEGVKHARARLEWRAPGLDVYLLGKHADVYDQSANIACNYALSIHIPLISLRRQSK